MLALVQPEGGRDGLPKDRVPDLLQAPDPPSHGFEVLRELATGAWTAHQTY